MFERIDGSKATPADLSVSTALEKFDIDTVRQLWLKAMERRETDPQGAITLARTLLEAVCKHILDEHGIEYDATGDLPALYKTVAKALNIAHPSSSKFSEVAPQLWKGSDHCAIASVMRTAKAGIPYVPPPPCRTGRQSCGCSGNISCGYAPSAASEDRLTQQKQPESLIGLGLSRRCVCGMDGASDF